MPQKIHGGKLNGFKSQATADSTFLQSDAASWQTDATSDASAADTFSKADDAAAQALGDSAASAEATVMTDQAASDQTQGNDDAAAETDFAQNEADQTMNSWNGLATSGMVGYAGDAWATFEYHKAQALDGWQTTADTNYKNYVSSLASDEVTYAGTDSQKFLSEAQTIDAADQTDGDDDADADQALVNTLAGDEVAYETVTATATASFQVAMAQAAHDYTVAVANAIDTYAHDNDNTKYTSALATASTNLSTAQQTAGTVYANGTTAANNADGLGAATATQETNDANALLTDATTVANDDLTDAQTADLQIDTYSKAESDAFDTQTKNDAAALDALIKGDADSLKTDAATADGSNPSSWMNAWSTEVAADDTKEDTQADDAMNATDQSADALDGTEKGEADAQQQKSDADAQAVHDKMVNDAQAADTKSTTDANNITAAVAKDAYFATLPDVYPAFDWSTVPDPAVLDASYDEVYAVDELALSLSAGQDDGSSPLPSGDVIGAMYITPAIGGASPLLPGEGQGEGGQGEGSSSPAPVLGQSFSLGATTDPYDQIPSIATPTGPGLLSDNGIYDPANPYAAGFTGWSGAQWLNVGQTLPGSGGNGSGGGGSGSGANQAPIAASVPKEDDMAGLKTGNELEDSVEREHVVSVTPQASGFSNPDIGPKFEMSWSDWFKDKADAFMRWGKRGVEGNQRKVEDGYYRLKEFAKERTDIADKSMRALGDRMRAFDKAVGRELQQLPLLPETLKNLPGAYLETGLSGEQLDSIGGFEIGLLNAFNPSDREFTGKPAFGHWGAYNQGQRVGDATAFVINVALMVDGAVGTVTIPVVMEGGRALALTPEVAAQVGISATEFNNITKFAAGAGNDARNIAAATQDHHAIPWDNKTWDHQSHPLVQEAGNPSLKTLDDNLRALEGHAGRHSTSYHQALRLRLDEAYLRVQGKGKEAALAELKKVIAEIWDDIASGDLRPYDHKDVVLPD